MRNDTKVRKDVLIYLNTDDRGNLINQSQLTRCRTQTAAVVVSDIFVALVVAHLAALLVVLLVEEMLQIIVQMLRNTNSEAHSKVWGDF